MNTINIAADATAQRIGIGNQYENEATAVVFDCSQFAEDHGAGTAQIIHRRPTESIGYVCTNVTQTNNSVTWLVTDDDTSFTGKGQVQLRWYVDDVLRESVIFPTYILPSVASSDDAPAEVKSALEQLMEWVNDNTISIEDLDERIANYFDEHPIPTPVTSVNEKLGDVVLTAEDVGAYSAEEADEKFCVPDGEYEELNAGTSKQLLSESYTLDQVPYLYRKSPDSDRAVEEIVGGTVGWNQLCKNGDFSDGANYWAKSDSQDSYSIDNGVYTLTLSSAPVNYYGHRIQNNPSTSISGHKVLCSCYMRSSKQCGFVIGLTNSTPASGLSKANTANQWSQVSNIMSVNANGTYSLQCSPGYSYSELSAGDTIDIKNIIITDLTTMFGTTIADYIYSLEQATAGAGVAKLKEWGFFTEDYYEYSEPTLRSVEGLVSKKTVGWNQWDEEWEVGSINNETGANSSGGTNRIRSKNYIPCLPNTEYCLWNGSGIISYLYFYDADKNFISIGSTLNVNPKVETTPQNCHYVRFRTNDNYGSTYNHDICINLSDPTKNGTYQPYESHTYLLDSSVVLRGVFKLDENNNLRADGDIYPADGNGSRRYGLVDLGELNWQMQGQGQFFYENASFDGANDTNGETLICSKYLGGDAYGGSADKCISIRIGTYKRIWIKDSSYSDVATFKTMLQNENVVLLYKTSTPTTFTATPYHNPQIVGDTEEWVTTGIVPAGHATRYYQNLRKKIENLPWNFATLIAPTEVTAKATRNYTAGSYLILNNVLYKVTSNIANGGTITPNTNCTATTIMAEFMSL